MMKTKCGITIHNMHKEKPHSYNVWDVRVDRHSLLGNPYSMKDESDRDRVCDQYQEYFDNKVARANDNPGFMNELRMLEDIFLQNGRLDLFCWCAPKRCHAETIRDYLIKSLGLI